MFIVYNLKFHCDPYQNASCIFHRIRKNNPKICMEPQKTLMAKAILRIIKLEISYFLISNYATVIVIIVIKTVWY